jgi:hypothetical protein
MVQVTGDLDMQNSLAGKMAKTEYQKRGPIKTTLVAKPAILFSKWFWTFCW